MLTKGQRVQLHPATERWMMGDRYGEIVSVSKRIETYGEVYIYRVKLDKSGKTMTFLDRNILEVVS